MAPSMSCADYTIYFRTACVYKYDMNFIISNADAVFLFFGNISLLLRFPQVVLFYFAFSI